MTVLVIKGKLNCIEKRFWYFLTLAIKIVKRTHIMDFFLKGCCLLYAFQFFVQSNSLLAAFLWTLSSCSTSGTVLLILDKLFLVWSYLMKINSESCFPSIPLTLLVISFSFSSLCLVLILYSLVDIMFWRTVIQVMSVGSRIMVMAEISC